MKLRLIVALTFSPSTLYALIGGVNFGHLMQSYRAGSDLGLDVLREISDSDFSSTDSEGEGDINRDFRIDSGFSSS